MTKAKRRRAGQRLRDWRKARKMKQQELARAIGTIAQRVSQIERGHHAPTLKQAVRIQKTTDREILCEDWI